MNFRRAAAVAAVLCMSLGAGICAKGALPPRFGGTPVIRLRARIAKLDPALAARPDEFTAALAIFEPLLKRNQDGTYAPILLEELPEASDDGLTYYFKLRKDILFHDGRALDSSDALHTVQRVVKSRRSPYSWIFDAVKGTSNYRSGKSPDIAGFKIVDERRFEIQLVKKNQNFLRYLCLPAAAIVPTIDHDFKPPVGTGPFKFGDMKPDGSISLVSFADYHEGRPYLDGLRFSVVRNDDDAMVEYRMSRLDVSNLPPDGLRSGDSNAGSPAQGAMKTILFLDVNPSVPEFSTAENRGLLSSALDRSSMVKIILNGRAQAESGGGGKKPSAHAKIGLGGKHELWFPDTGKAMRFIAQKAKHDLDALGLNIELVPKQLSDLTRYGTGSAPALILRELPAPLDISETVDRTLLSASYISPWSAIALKLQGGKVPAGGRLYLPLLSYKTNYLCRSDLTGVYAGSFSQLGFDLAGMRKKGK